ncbi:sulfatase [Flammeovirga kamogawensis]|nr:sulfatase [Flammeovirga kamogawensis]MBB6463539.1 arylsulfatase A-like enzyme [Flammeovirga kamogawensis]
MMMKHYLTITLFFGLLFSLTLKAQDKPNIVLLFVDDYGWSDLNYRNKTFTTPNIDQLKKESLEFTRAYIPTPTCSPSRASILTGKEAARLQMPRHIKDEFPDGSNTKEFGIWSKDPAKRGSRNWLPLEEVTYAEKLKEFGYYNAFMGKWHLGHQPYHPIHQGFDEQTGTSNFGHPKSYYAPFFKNGPALEEYNNDKDAYLTDVLTDKAVNFIKEYDKEKPFMLSLWYYTVHGPHIGRKDLIQKYIDQGMQPAYAKYHAMVETMDASVGAVRAALKEKGIDDNTVIIFTSDQGGFFENLPLAGGKRNNTLGEGGARVPMLINYPGVTKANTECTTPIQTIDVFPTLMEIASNEKYKDGAINGVSLMPLIQEKKIKSRNLYFFRSYEDQYAAVMNGDWKLVKYFSGKYQLFNVVEDISEQKDLIDIEVKRATKMQKDLAAWEKEVYAGWKEVTEANSVFFQIPPKRKSK